MKNSKNMEIALCAGLGIGIGLMLSRAMEWSWWIAIPLSVIIAGAIYHPREWIAAVRERFTPWTTKNLKKNALAYLSWIAYVAYIAVGWLMAVTPFFLLLLYISTVDGSRKLEKEPGTTVFLFIVTGSFLGGAMLLIGDGCNIMFRNIQRKPKRFKDSKWSMPMSRRLPRLLMPSRNWYLWGWDRSLWSRMACVTWKIPVAQALGIYTLVILFVDFTLTVAIVCATTRQTAVMTSAFVGAAVGTLLGALNTLNPGVGVVTGIIVGTGVGLVWFPIATALKRSRWDQLPAME